MDIKWQEGAVCFADGEQWFVNEEFNNTQYQLSNENSDTSTSFNYVLLCDDYQLNTIKQGDYSKASELDTEQKYSDVVEVFGLFGYKDCTPHIRTDLSYLLLADSSGAVCACSKDYSEAKRKLTYSQIMAIGELKRLEIERGKLNPPEIPDSCEDVVNKPSHYQFFEGVEVIEIIASSMNCGQFKGYCLGNRIKYRLRAGNKDKLEQEIAKSDKYIELYDEHKHLCRIDGDLK